MGVQHEGLAEEVTLSEGFHAAWEEGARSAGLGRALVREGERGVLLGDSLDHVTSVIFAWFLFLSWRSR